MVRLLLKGIAIAAVALMHLPAGAQRPLAPPLPGPRPTVAEIVYAPSGPGDGQGHLLDLYLPPDVRNAPLVIFSHGSAWMADNGRMDAQAVAAQLNKAGFAVAGVSIRTSTQTKFPGQLHDIKAAIRWLRANAARYGYDGARIGIMGESSGGWTAAMAAVTGDVPALDGAEGNVGVSSTVQAAIAFYPPTDFVTMDAWATKPCDPKAGPTQLEVACHDRPGSPESMLIGCAIQTCREKAAAADPIRYISRADPPIMVIHGEADELVPHQQGEALYQALNKACHEAAFVTMPIAPHGVWYQMLSGTTYGYGTTLRTTSAEGCKSMLPQPFQLDWGTVIAFFTKHLKGG